MFEANKGGIAVREETLKAKICLVGEAAVGKTSLIRRYVKDQFEDKYITTLGAKVSKKEMSFEVPKADMNVHLIMVIWDIMGEKTFRDLTKEAFFHGTKGILAVCDLTRYNTLRELDDWIESVFGVVGEIPAGKARFDAIVAGALEEATLVSPSDPYQASGGRDGMHTEYLGPLLAEMQWLQRSLPGASW